MITDLALKALLVPGQLSIARPRPSQQKSERSWGTQSLTRSHVTPRSSLAYRLANAPSDIF